MNYSGSLLILVALTTAASAAGPDARYKVPRTETGQPDLRGVWNFASNVPLERPMSAGDRTFFTREELEARKAAKAKAMAMISKLVPVEAVSLDWLESSERIEDLRTSLITYPDNGRLPPLVDGVRRVPGVDEILNALAEANGAIPPALANFLAPGKRDGHEDFGPAERCLFGGGPPLTPDVDNIYIQIIQAKDHVVLMSDRRARIVPIDGRPRVAERLRSWAGDARGHWDGDTLVVETSNFNRRTLSFAGAGNALEKVVTERFTRVSNTVLNYEATIVDPKTFQDKVVFSLPVGKTDTRIYESACHEGNYALSNILSGARKEEQDAALAKR